MSAHVLTQALSASAAPVKLDTWTEPLADGDLFLLCSDGLTRQVPEVEIGSALAICDQAAAVRLLIDMANASGGHDNVTAVVVGWNVMTSIE
ncbi:MAG: hypothetical protein R3B70_48925 [Polyangiaceae bacterium]